MSTEAAREMARARWAKGPGPKTKACLVCGQPCRCKYCSNACRQKAKYQRNKDQNHNKL